MTPTTWTTRLVAGSRWVLGLWLLPCVATVLLGQADPAQQGTQAAFRAAVHTVPIYASVRSKDGHLTVGLAKDDFRVFEDGQRVDVVQFSAETQPVTVAVMLQASMDFQTLRGRQAVDHFIDALLPGDRAMVGTFQTNRIALRPFLTEDRRLLHRIIDEELWPSGGGHPWAAIDAAMTVLHGEQGRRVVLVLSSGANGLSRITADLRRRVVAEEVMVYSMVFGGTGGDLHYQSGVCPGFQNCHGKGGISGAGGAAPGTDLAGTVHDSGGAQFVAGTDDDLAATMTQVAEELRRQYVLAFVPRNLDGRSHKIKVETAKGGLQVRHRQTYIAEAR